MPIKLFISYADADDIVGNRAVDRAGVAASEKLGAALAAVLRRAGYAVTSADSLNPGEQFADDLTAAWRAADAFVIVLSRQYLKSRFRLIELGAAIGSACDGKPVVVIRQGNERLPMGEDLVRVLDVGGQSPKRIAAEIAKVLDHTPAAASA